MVGGAGIAADNEELFPRQKVRSSVVDAICIARFAVIQVLPFSPQVPPSDAFEDARVDCRAPSFPQCMRTHDAGSNFLELKSVAAADGGDSPGGGGAGG